MADAVTELRLPQGDAVTGERPHLTPDELRIQGFQDTAGPFRKGLRSAVNSVAGGALQLAGSIGENLGLRDFAAQRFAEAADFVQFADAVGPDTRDYRQVKDVADAMDFAQGLAGQAAGSMLPAFAGGALGARAGLRGAIAGAYGGSFVPNAGEQALRVKDEGTPGERLANALGTGAVSAALDTAPIAMGLRGVQRAARGIGPRATFGGTVGKQTLAEAGTETAQEALGQQAHSLIAPARDTSDDTAQLINAALGGAIGGAGFGAGTGGAQTLLQGMRKVAGRKLDQERPQTLDEVRGELGTLERPQDPNDLTGAPDDMDAVPAWLDEKDATDAKSLGRWLDRMKGKPWADQFTDMNDPDQREGFFNELSTRMRDSFDKPEMKGRAKKFGDWVKKLTGSEQNEGKSNLQRTALDAAIFDNMLKRMDPKKVEMLSPTERLQLASDLKSYVLSGYASRQPLEGPMPADARRGFEPETPPAINPLADVGPGRLVHKPTVRSPEATPVEGDRTTIPAQIPHALMDIFGDSLPEVLDTTNEILRAEYAPDAKARSFRKPVERATKARRDYQSRLEQTVEGSLQDQYAAMPQDQRKVAVQELTRWLTRQVTQGPDNGDWEQFNQRVNTFFGGNAERIIGAFEQERDSISRDWEHFMDEGDLEAKEQRSAQDVAERLAQNERFNVSLEDASATEEMQDANQVEDSEVPETSPFRDKRLGVPYEEITEAKNVLDALRRDYDPRVVKFRQEPVLDKDGNMTGKVTLHAEDAQASTEFSEEQWQAIREDPKIRKSGAEAGVITVLRKTDKTDKMPWKVSLPNLVAETMSSIGRSGDGPDFVFDMLLRGLGNLMSDPKFTGFSPKTATEIRSGSEGIKIPDNAIVWARGNERYTWGQLRKRAAQQEVAKEQQYWQRVVEHLNQLAVEHRARAQAGNGGDPAIQEYIELRRAVERQEEGAMDAYRQFVKEWAQEREEYASGYASDEREPGKGMIGISAIEESFNRDRRIELLERRLKGTPTIDRGMESPGGERRTLGAKGLLARKAELEQRVSIGENVGRELGSVNYRIGRINKELEFLRKGFSSTLRENEIEQTARRGTEPKERKFQEETGIPLVGPAARAPRRGDMGDRAGGEVTTTPPQKLGRKEAARVKSGQGAFGDSSQAKAKRADEISQALNRPFGKGKPKFSLTDSQKKVMAKRLRDMGEDEWMEFVDRVGTSTNKDALNDTLDYLDSPEFLDQFKDLMQRESVEGRRFTSRLDELTGTIGNVLAKMSTPEDLAEMRLGREKMDAAREKEIKEYVEKVLGPKAAVEFRSKLPHDAAGMALTDEEKIIISVRALDPKSVAFHESLHTLMARLKADRPGVASVLEAAASAPRVVAQLKKLLEDHPRAQAQLSDPEERLAYMYQFWAAGKLQIGPKAEGVFQKIKSFVSKLLSAWTEISREESALPRAEKVLEAFHNGRLAKRSEAGKVLDELLPPKSDKWMARWGDLAAKTFFTADGFIRGMDIEAFTEVADKMFSPSEQQGKESGMLQTRHVRRNQFMNQYVDAVKGLTEEQIEKVRTDLSGGEVSLTPAERRAANEIRAMLKDVFEYMQKSNVKIVEWNGKTEQYDELPIHYQENYVPRVIDRQKLVEKAGEFIAALSEAGIGNAGDVWSKMVAPTKADPNESDWTAGLVFYAPNTMHRKLDIPDAVLRPFMEDNLGAIMYKYINYSVRRAEYARRFGNQGQEIALAAEKAKQQGATAEQIKSFNQYVQAMEGSLGNNIDPKLQSFFGGVMTYQNLRLLPLALFSSLVDPLGILVRGGTANEAFGAFTRGIKELFKDVEDGDREFAKTVGAINAATDEQMMADAYGANFTKGWQRWMNKKLFQMNGMESWNNSMRIAGAAAAQRFIARHAKGENEHSERYLAELGLKKEDVRVTGDSLELTPQVVDAINKWVDGAVLRPHAAVRPIWMSDPHWMLVSHLKQFTYSFHKTIIARAVHEAKHGNVAPVMTMASYVPFIIAADLLRGLVTPGGADDRRLEKWGLGDWMAHGVSRAGITGPGQYALDIRSDLEHGGLGIESVAGPSIQQLFDILRAVGGARDAGREAMRAIPGVPALNLE